MELPELSMLFAREMLRAVPARTSPIRTRTGRWRTGRSGWITTFDGAGVLAGDLTPQCADVVTAVLDALVRPGGGGGHAHA